MAACALDLDAAESDTLHKVALEDQLTFPTAKAEGFSGGSRLNALPERENV
jgi:hypothetical protein